MSPMTRIALEPYFLHQDQVQSLLGEQRTESARARAARRNDPEAALPYILAEKLAEALPTLGVSELATCALKQDLRTGQIVGAEHEFGFQRDWDHDAPGYKPVTFTAVLDAGRPVRVTGTFNSARTASSSATGNLTGSRRAYLIGTVTDLASERIELRPVFIGIRSLVDDDLAAEGLAPGLRVYPSDIGQFRGIDFACPVSEAELEAVLHVPEDTVKRAFAGLIGESYVPKDWGGERSDLYSSRVFARGCQVSAAWLFKGPSYPRAMDVKALGKNGDQIDRLFTEPADLLVLQHCHQIKPTVVGMMDAYAHDARRPRSFMIIDGADTGRILRSLGLLPVAQAHPPLQNQRTPRSVLGNPRKIETPRRSTASGPFEPEPVLAETQYEQALSVLRNARNALERTPAMTANLDEEKIRDLLLVFLNAQFEGAAAGEVFNAAGKTDILIRADDRNVFIAECKIWKGPKTIRDALSQLLSYLAWRDTKAALLLFIRTGEPTTIITESIAEIEGHTNYKKTHDTTEDGERYDFTLHANGDMNKEIKLAFLPFALQDTQYQQ
jgi:hypothetical protein